MRILALATTPATVGFVWLFTAVIVIGSPNALLAQPGSEIINPLSQFEITVDGQFTDANEWSDIDPAWFMSPAVSGSPVPVPPLDPSANSLLYAGIAPGTAIPAEGLYLLYAYLPRTNPVFTAGEFIADIDFPVSLSGNPQDKTDITVQFRGGSSVGAALAVANVDVLVDIDSDGVADQTAASLGMEGAVGFGKSPLSGLIDHLLVELEVPLLIPEGFGTPNDPFPPGGLPDGIYSPDPAFWGANIANDLLDPPASAAIFTIQPDGSTIVRSLPEPSAGLLAIMGLTIISTACRRVRKPERR
jgi:hypothetical protein